MRVNSIQLLIDETKKCLECNNHLAALIVALTIPDVCGKVLYPNDRNGQRYKKWFDLYIGNYEQCPFDKDKPKEEQMPYMNGEVFYKLRCAMLHEGSDDISNKISIDEFNLMFGKSANLETKFIEQRTDYLSDGTTKTYPKIVKWNINVHQLCQKIIWASEAFLKNEAKDKETPTIQIYPELNPIWKVK